MIAGVLVAIAAVVAVVLERRRPDAPPRTAWPVPVQLDRADFDGPSVPWIVAVFTSATCASCGDAVAKTAPLASDAVVVQEVDVATRRDLHTRYGIEAVPTIVVAGRDGVVRASFVGPPTATDLWAAVAEARYPGSSPEPDVGRAAPG